MQDSNRTSIRKIGVLTSGGDAPGMNACIRAVVRTALRSGIEVAGIMRGYAGLIDSEFIELDFHSVSGIIQRGGTILKSARSPRFHSHNFRKQAYANMQEAEMDALVVIGGDGTFTGAKIFGEAFDVPIIGTPGTIDNDLYGTDYTIGFDTALNTALDAIDRIRDTATSHNRMFFVEVMGKDAGYIALNTGIAGGAVAILIPESKTSIDKLCEHLRNQKRTYSSSIVVVAEGDDEGGAAEVAAKVKAQFDEYDTRVTVLGHVQRGGKPSCQDRVLGTRLGVAATRALMNGKGGMMAGVRNGEVAFTPFDKAIKHHQEMNPHLLELAGEMNAYY